MSNMTTWRVVVVLVVALTFTGGRSVHAQTDSASLSPLRNTQPVTAVRTLTGYTYQEGVSLEIELGETPLIPGARGVARVERRRGASSVRLEVNDMKPATGFGGDFATYVLWTISPEGQVENTGELVLRDRRATLNATTPQQTFGMIVTAEPHSLVRRPSTFVVLENLTRTNTTTVIMPTVTLEYRGYEGTYRFEQESLVGEPYARGDVRTEVAQARLAVRLAELAGAATFTPDELDRARQLFDEAVDALEQRRSERIVTTYAHDAIRLAVNAEVRSEELRFQAALDAERATNAAELQAMERAIERAQSATERAQLEAEQREFELNMEREARESARIEALAANRRADDAEAQSLEAMREREAALARMRDALSTVAETRTTARGFIVNLPEILFDFNVSALKPDAREVLSRICGVLSITEGYRLDIEGHTDSVGSEEYNQTLSEERAQSVYDYLYECRLRGTVLTTRGLGETSPIATNDTAEGRSRNRRVELAVRDTRQ